jgi:hypothetical protein
LDEGVESQVLVLVRGARMESGIPRREDESVTYAQIDHEIRTMNSRPTLHPYSRHRTSAGPIRHEMLPALDGMIRGRLWLGMRKYGYVTLSVPGGLKGNASAALYSNAIKAAIETAWRC